jgi:hypothetical protein
MIEHRVLIFEPEFDEICLNCGHRIGSHSMAELSKCAKEYDEHQTKLSDY